MAKAKSHADTSSDETKQEQAEPKKKESAPAKAVRKGDFIKLEFDAWKLDPDGENLFDTTDEAKAKEAEIAKEGVRYAPIPMIIGAGRVFAGLDKALEGAKVGEDINLTIDPKEGAGDRNPTDFKYFKIAEFEKKKIDIEMGKEVVLDNRVGYITAITSGRIKVDFNQPLAGKKLKYRFKIVELLEDFKDKVSAVIEMDYGTSEGFEVKKDGDEGVSISLADVCKYDQKWFLAKYRVVADLREHLKVHNTSFIETYVKKEDKAAGETVDGKTDAGKTKKESHGHSHEGHDHSHEGHDHSHEGHDHSHEGHDHAH